MRQRDVPEGDDDHAGRTSDQLEAALVMRAVGRVGTRHRMPERRVPDEGDVSRVEGPLLAQLQIQTPAIVEPADVLITNDVPGRREHQPERRDDHCIRDTGFAEEQEKEE